MRFQAAEISGLTLADPMRPVLAARCRTSVARVGWSRKAVGLEMGMNGTCPKPAACHRPRGAGTSLVAVVGAGLTVRLVCQLCGHADATIVGERLREADELRAYRTQMPMRKQVLLRDLGRAIEPPSPEVMPTGQRRCCRRRPPW